MTAPTTPFEDSADVWATWTTLAEEQTFLAALAADSPRASYGQIGTSVGGRRVDLVRIGYPNAPTEQQLSAAWVMFINGMPHGNEPSGREAVLHFVRDLAYTTDPAVTGYLSEHPLLVVPTTNPDGRTTDVGKRHNDANRDINRDYLQFQDPEPAAVGAILLDYSPDVYVDCHERSVGPSYDFETLPCDHPNTDSVVLAFGVAFDTAVKSGIEAASYTVQPYPPSALTNSLRAHAGLRHKVAVLIEAYGQDNRDGITRKGAVTGYLAAFHAALSWHAANAESLAEGSFAAAERKAQEGFARTSLSQPALTPGPAGYRLTSGQAASTQVGRDLTGMVATPVPGSSDVYVSLSQPAQPVVPLMLDGSAPDNVVAGERLDVSPVAAQGAVRAGTTIVARHWTKRAGVLAPNGA